MKLSNPGRKVNAKILTNMQKMVHHVERAGRMLHCWEDDPNRWTFDKVTRLYETIHGKSQKGKRRHEGLTWMTYFNMVKRLKVDL